MKLAAVFVSTLLLSAAAGYLSASKAACRQCNSKTCYFQADCGRLCICVVPGGAKGKRGSCMEVTK